jgi:hypothetical protein
MIKLSVENKEIIAKLEKNQIEKIHKGKIRKRKQMASYCSG